MATQHEGGWKLGGVLSAPAAIGLTILFFMPWVKIQCSPANAPDEQKPTPQQIEQMKAQAPKGLISDDGAINMGQASGYELAMGRISPPDVEDPEGRMKQEQPDEGDIQARPLFWAGIALPVLLLLGGLNVMAGKTSPRTWAVLALIFTAAGAGLCYQASQVSYAEDMASASKKKQDPNANPMAQAMQEQMAEAMNKMLRSQPTDYLKASAIVYGAVGLLCLPGLIAPGRRMEAGVKKTRLYDPNNKPKPLQQPGEVAKPADQQQPLPQQQTPHVPPVAPSPGPGQASDDDDDAKPSGGSPLFQGPKD